MPRSRQLTPPFGYRRLFILLREQGEPSGVNRIYRLYREEGLTVPQAQGPAKGHRNSHVEAQKEATMPDKKGRARSYKFAIRLTSDYIRAITDSVIRASVAERPIGLPPIGRRTSCLSSRQIASSMRFPKTFS